MNWSAVEAVSTFVTAVVALYLLGQGQRERRRIRDDQRSAQARDVLVRVEEIWEPVKGDTARQFKGAKVVVTNHSDRPIAIEGLDYIRHHQPEHPDLGPVQVTGLDVQEHRLIMGGASAEWQRYQEGGFAIVEFRDHDGQRWQRRSDVQDLRKWPSPIRWWQRGIQGLCRARPSNWLLLRPWERAAFRSAKRHGPDRVPFGLKMTRFLFGYWPAGEPDPWRDTAAFLPALFGYTELYEVSTGHMSYPSRRADEQRAPWAPRTLSRLTPPERSRLGEGVGRAGSGAQGLTEAHSGSGLVVAFSPGCPKMGHYCWL